MYVSKAEEMRCIDRRTINEYKIPGIVLMENAARAVYDRIVKLNKGDVAIVCGTGNNGGDGFALSRILLSHGYRVSVFCFGDLNRATGDARVNLDILLSMGIDVESDLNTFSEYISTCGIVVDALLGTGARGNITGIYEKVVEIINASGKYIISVDIPTGIDSDNGKKLGNCINANETVTFGTMKYGHVLGEGRNASGIVYVDKISIPDDCIEKQGIYCRTNFGNYPECLIKRRENDTNKGDYGRVYVIGGSFQMSGAVILTSMAAIRTGAGLVTCVIPESIIGRVGSRVVEATYYTTGEKNGHMELSQENLDDILTKADVISFGMGLGRTPELRDSLKYILEKSEKPVVVDADGINMLADIKDVLINSKAPVVLTPHPGEMSRLTGKSIDYINENRVEITQKFAKQYRCIVLLKGSSTVVTDGIRTYINTSGNPGMATGGSGDVLTGVISSLIGQVYDMYISAVIGSFIHGSAGDTCYETYGYGLTAGDIINNLGIYLKG